MRKFTWFLLILLIVSVGGGLVFLATWDIPAPSKKVEKVLDNGKFPR
jgi:cell division septal protein FtsQ